MKFKFWIPFACNGVFKLKACWPNCIDIPTLEMTAKGHLIIGVINATIHL